MADSCVIFSSHPPPPSRTASAWGPSLSLRGRGKKTARLFLIFCALFAVGAPPALAAAQAVPIPTRKQDVLAENTAAMREKQARQAELKENLAKVDDEIEGLKSNMVSAARDVKTRERAMTKLENKIDDLQEKRTALQKKLQRDYRGISGLAGAMMRLRHVPPEVLMARPGAPLDTAQAAMVLRGAVQPLQAHAIELQQDLAVLDQVEKDLRGQQVLLKDEAKKILADQTKLQELIRRREAAYASLKSDLATQEEDLRKLAQEAQDFRDLVQKLEDRNRALAAAQEEQEDRRAKESEGQGRLSVPASLPARRHARADERILRSFGDAQLPVSGRVRLKFGQMNEIGAASEGLKIEGRAGGVVVAPLNGIVRYKGFFKNYGNMMIIEHGKNYHSLVAGLAKIDTVVGQSVSAGEPVGTLGTTRTARPNLYYELRLNGKPVNPADLFPDAG